MITSATARNMSKETIQEKINSFEKDYSYIADVVESTIKTAIAAGAFSTVVSFRTKNFPNIFFDWLASFGYSYYPTHDEIDNITIEISWKPYK